MAVAAAALYLMSTSVPGILASTSQGLSHYHKLTEEKPFTDEESGGYIVYSNTWQSRV